MVDLLLWSGIVVTGLVFSVSLGFFTWCRVKYGKPAKFNAGSRTIDQVLKSISILSGVILVILSFLVV
jgi:hypothetical protein